MTKVEIGTFSCDMILMVLCYFVFPLLLSLFFLFIFRLPTFLIDILSLS